VGSSPTEPTILNKEKKMIYTVIYEEENTGNMGTFTFAAQRHDKNYAWAEFTEKYAEKGQEPVAIMSGQSLVYFIPDISFTNVG
tara:strand:+ start:100 stop:351 length:252 start_codon:yes stop_codon:yes gene_type:complete